MTDVDLAPVYRYFTADLLTDEILAEIPFSGVTYERAVKAAGAFDGSIPVIQNTRSMNLYENTMPGNTALYVVRNGVCVWGGIIWSRTHDLQGQNLSVSGNEFPSYYHHRKIWKTINHAYGATVVVTAGAAVVTLDYGSTTALQPGASVSIIFSEQTQFTYNNTYILSEDPAPTTIGFSIDSMTATSAVQSIRITDNIVTVYSAAPHGFSVGDVVVISGVGVLYDGSHTITTIGGAALDQYSFPFVHANVAQFTTTGTTTRTVPDGTYEEATITVQTDTYDYVRGLLDAVNKDFVGIDFAQPLLEPGLSYRTNITSKALSGGSATLTTEFDHGLSLGQAVQVADLGEPFDGEYPVTSIPTATSLTYAQSGTMTTTPVTATVATVVSVSLLATPDPDDVTIITGYEALITTAADHGFLVGQTVNMASGYNLGNASSYFTGDYQITEIPSTTTFKYNVLGTQVIPDTPQTGSTATVGASTAAVIRYELTSNEAILTTNEPSGFLVGNSVTVVGVSPTYTIAQKSLDAALSEATVTTNEDQNLATGDSVVITGLSDSSNLRKITIKGTSNPRIVIFETTMPHNFSTGNVVTINDLVDTYKLSHGSLTSNVATLTTVVPHNLAVSDWVTMSNILDPATITKVSLTSNIATITVGTHNYKVNQNLAITKVTEHATVTDRETHDKKAYLTTNTEHNFQVGNSITVSGLGAPYDGKHKISSVTETRVIFSIKDTAVRKPTRHSGSISSPSSIFNGQHVVTAVTGTTVSYALTGNDKDNTTVSAAVTGDSILNGKFQITARTSTTFQYALVANNIGSFSIPNIKHPKKGLSDKARKALANQIQAVATTPSRFLGDHTLTAVTRNTISFKQSTGLVTESDTTDVKHGSVTVKSVFNGTYTITSSDTDEDSFTYAKTARSNVLETPTAGMSFVTAPGIFNGVHTITAVDTALNTIRYAVTHANIDPTPAAGLSSATITPGIIVSTFGPYPGNSDIGIKFSTQEYSGVDVIPTNFIGSELTTLGDALDTYSDTINGFEYRIDCDFDPDTQQFTKTFVLIPINFPDPPGAGEVSPLSRFGADKLVFEYPGNISNLSISESADNSSTRFFATGTTTDSSINVSSAASQTDQFNGINGSRKIRKWPILDETTSVNDISDETVLYAYASRYLNESKPPDATLTVTVNGSLEPLVGSYGPGEWCSLIVDDDFVKARLTSDLEPREDVIVRKIDSYKVTVPDGTTFPELVDLTLVPEWGVDTVG